MKALRKTPRNAERKSYEASGALEGRGFPLNCMDSVLLKQKYLLKQLYNF